MKNIFKKLHIGSSSSNSHDPNRSNDVASSPSSNSALSPATPAASVHPAPATATATAAAIRQDYYSSEEEYQIQLALALSVSSGRNEAEKEKAANDIVVRGDEVVVRDRGGAAAVAELQARQYWVSLLWFYLFLFGLI